jgi:hypothetical protein
MQFDIKEGQNKIFNQMRIKNRLITIEKRNCEGQ